MERTLGSSDTGAATGSKQWQHRCIPPDVTIERLERVREVVGITRVANLTGLDRVGIPVVQAVRPLGKLLTVAQGKGVSMQAARASAMMEATEIWHAEIFAPEGHPAIYRDLGAEMALDPAVLMNSDASAPPREMLMYWTPARDLASGEYTLVPRDCGNLDFTREADPPGLRRNTNGLAGGNTYDEALASSLAEVIERAARVAFRRLDAHARAQRRLDPDLVARNHPLLGDLIARITDAKLRLDLFDLTNALGVTVIEAVIYETATRRPCHRPSQGHGAHLDPVTAIARAVTEAAQTRITFISGNRDDLDPIHYTSWTVWAALSAMESQIDFACDRRGLDLTDRSASDPKGDVALMVERIVSCGAGPVLVLDLSQTDVAIPVTKVIAPNLALVPQVVHRGSA